jgi:uncharacterized protein (TIGR03000 family)
MRRYMFLALPALALALLLSLPESSFAQRRGGGGYRGGGWNGSGWNGGGWYGGYGGYRGPSINIGVGGYGYGRGNYAPYYGGGWYSYSSPYYVDSAPVYGDGVISSGYQSFYPPTGAIQNSTDASRALVRVRVPANAQVFFDDSPTTQTGPARTFMTGPLEPGTYSYNISARWMENGQERRENRSVRVTPGQTADVDFMTAAPSPAPTPRCKASSSL